MEYVLNIGENTEIVKKKYLLETQLQELAFGNKWLACFFVHTNHVVQPTVFRYIGLVSYL